MKRLRVTTPHLDLECMRTDGRVTDILTTYRSISKT